MRRLQVIALALLALSAGTAAQWAPGAAVKVGKAPNFIKITPDGKQAVVANYGSNDLSLLRVDAAKPEDRRIPAGFGPLGMAFSADGQGLYVANKDSGLIKEFKLPGFEMVDSYKVGNIPTDLAATPDGYSLLVANFGKGKFGRVDVLDLQKKRVVESIQVGVRPLAVVTNPGGSVAYVANSASNTLSVISLEVYKVIETIPVGDGPVGLSMSRNGRKLFIAHSRSNELWVYDVRRKTVLHKIALPEGPFRIAVSPGERFLAIPCYGANAVALVDSDATAESKVVRVAVKKNPVEAVFLPDGLSLLVACEGDDRVMKVAVPAEARPAPAKEGAAND